MDPQSQIPLQSSGSHPWRKPLVILGALLIFAALVAAGFMLFGRSSGGKSTPNAPHTSQGSKDFKMTTPGSPISYAGSMVYDACGLIPFDVIRQNVKDYQAILNMNGTDKKPSKPLSIEHNYFDRNIASVLGSDGEPRSRSTSIGGEQTVSASSFLSEADSNCWYGQGEGLSLGLGNIFAKVYVMQRPAPLSAEFTAYLATLNKTASQGDIDVYVEPQTDNGGFFTGIVTNIKQGVAVTVKASTRELAERAVVSAGETISEAPKAPMNLIYPLAWSKMPNPCTLLTADDFTKATGKSASALAEDTLFLNELGGRLMQRSCERLELERLDGTPITKSNITVRLMADEAAAKSYVQTLKADKSRYRFHPVKQRIQIANEAYVVEILRDDGKPPSHEFHMRIGNAVIIFTFETDNGPDSSAEAFTARFLPLAKSIAERYRQN